MRANLKNMVICGMLCVAAFTTATQLEAKGRCPGGGCKGKTKKVEILERCPCKDKK